MKVYHRKGSPRNGPGNKRKSYGGNPPSKNTLKTRHTKEEPGGFRAVWMVFKRVPSRPTSTTTEGSNQPSVG